MPLDGVQPIANSSSDPASTLLTGENMPADARISDIEFISLTGGVPFENDEIFNSSMKQIMVNLNSMKVLIMRKSEELKVANLEIENLVAIRKNLENQSLEIRDEVQKYKIRSAELEQKVEQLNKEVEKSNGEIKALREAEDNLREKFNKEKSLLLDSHQKTLTDMMSESKIFTADLEQKLEGLNKQLEKAHDKINVLVEAEIDSRKQFENQKSLLLDSREKTLTKIVSLLSISEVSEREELDAKLCDELFEANGEQNIMKKIIEQVKRAKDEKSNLLAKNVELLSRNEILFKEKESLVGEIISLKRDNSNLKNELEQRDEKLNESRKNEENWRQQNEKINSELGFAILENNNLVKIAKKMETKISELNSKIADDDSLKLENIKLNRENEMSAKKIKTLTSTTDILKRKKEKMQIDLIVSEQKLEKFERENAILKEKYKKQNLQLTSLCAENVKLAKTIATLKKQKKELQYQIENGDIMEFFHDCFSRLENLEKFVLLFADVSDISSTSICLDLLSNFTSEENAVTYFSNDKNDSSSDKTDSSSDKSDSSSDKSDSSSDKSDSSSDRHDSNIDENDFSSDKNDSSSDRNDSSSDKTDSSSDRNDSSSDKTDSSSDKNDSSSDKNDTTEESNSSDQDLNEKADPCDQKDSSNQKSSSNRKNRKDSNEKNDGSEQKDPSSQKNPGDQKNANDQKEFNEKIDLGGQKSSSNQKDSRHQTDSNKKIASDQNDSSVGFHSNDKNDSEDENDLGVEFYSCNQSTSSEISQKIKNLPSFQNEIIEIWVRVEIFKLLTKKYCSRLKLTAKQIAKIEEYLRNSSEVIINTSKPVPNIVEEIIEIMKRKIVAWQLDLVFNLSKKEGSPAKEILKHMLKISENCDRLLEEDGRKF